MLCDPARRRGRGLATLLAFSLGLSLFAVLPAPAAGQTQGLLLVVEQPAAGSAVRGPVLVSGWAVDTTTGANQGSGIVADSVQVWLGPAGSGRLLDVAGYGDPRGDVAERFGNARFLLSGFRYFWDSCDAPEGPNVLTVQARSSGPGGRVASASVPLTVGSCMLSLGETVNGRIQTGGQTDEWFFDGTAGQRVAITLDGVGGWDTFMELIAPDGSREDTDDDGGPDLNSWLSRRLGQTGRYTVLARPLSTEGCTGDYVVMAWTGPPGQSGPNRAAGGLGTTAQYSFRGSLREFGERQRWSLHAQAGQEMIIEVPRNVGSRLDPFVELLGPDGQLLARDDDSGGGLNSFLQEVLPQEGDYTLVVQSAREDCGGDYTLSVEDGWGAQSRERGDLAFGDAVSGALSLATRRDVWSFPATAGERLTLALDSSGPVRLQLAAPNGDWEQSRSSRGRGLGLSFEPGRTGTYQAVVLIDTSRSIDYSLTLERGFGRLVSEKGPIQLGQPVSGEIRFSEGRDLYTFEGRQGQQVRIALDRPGRSQLDPYLELLGPDGRTLAEDDDSGGELNSLIQLSLPSNGTYTVVARGLGDSAGQYTLTVTLSNGDSPSPAPPRGPGAPGPGPGPTPTPGGPAPGPGGPAPSPTPTPSPAR